jgi:hypothetical protein
MSKTLINYRKPIPSSAYKWGLVLAQAESVAAPTLWVATAWYSTCKAAKAAGEDTHRPYAIARMHRIAPDKVLS